MRFCFGFLSAIVVTIMTFLIVIWTGLINVAATHPSPILERVLAFAAARSIDRHATAMANPVATEPQVLAVGLRHYAEMCLMCHGAPEVEPQVFARHLSPKPPPLTAASVQASSDGTLFWIITNGIMATGMPAFGPTHSDEELWTLVTFLRHLPQLSPMEREHLLTAQSGSHQAGHTHEHAEHKH
jgi:mono/diheme cytochrome c family protein